MLRGLIALSICLCAGCGGGADIASVEGLVTMDGQPMSGATVIFTPDVGGRPAAARTDQEGRYVLNFSGGRQGAIPGLNRVRVTTKSDPYEAADGTRVPAQPETVPMEYNQQSTLQFEVVDGQSNIANFELKSGGKVLVDAAGGY